VADRALTKAREVGGSVRLISRSDGGRDSTEVNTVLQDIHNNQATSAEDIMETLSGFVQV